MGKSSDNETICALVQMCQDLKEKLSTVKGKMNSPHLTEQDRVRLESLHRQLAEQQRIQLEHLFKVLLPYMRGWATSPQFTKFREVQDSRVHDEKNYISHDSSARKTSSPAPRTTSLQYNGEIEDDDFTKIAATLFRYILEALPRLPSLEPDRNPVGLLRKAVYRRMVDEVKRRNPQRSKKTQEHNRDEEQKKTDENFDYSPQNDWLVDSFFEKAFDIGLLDPDADHEINRCIDRVSAEAIVQEVLRYWKETETEPEKIIKIASMRTCVPPISFEDIAANLGSGHSIAQVKMSYGRALKKARQHLKKLGLYLRFDDEETDK